MNHTFKLALILLTVASGCSRFDLRKRIPWGAGGDGHLETPKKLIAIWTETIAHTPGKSPQRGFGGRLFFYAADDKDPIKIKGQLEIYGFDEANRSQADTKPDKKIIYPPEVFARQFSDGSPMGPSYSVWVPWDEVGEPEKEISLIARFTPKNGTLVLSEMTTHILHGTAPPKQELSPAAQDLVYAVRQVAHETERPENAQMQVKTIPTRGMNLPVIPTQQRTKPTSATPAANLSTSASQPSLNSAGATSIQSVEATQGWTLPPQAVRSGPGSHQAAARPFAPLNLARTQWLPSPAERPSGLRTLH